jgi:hypothetical protein
VKLTDDDFKELAALVQPFDNDKTRDYAKGAMHSDKRFRWDCLWMANHTHRAAMSAWFSKVYRYCDDSHIDTALRRIIPALNQPSE